MELLATPLVVLLPVETAMDAAAPEMPTAVPGAMPTADMSLTKVLTTS